MVYEKTLFLLEEMESYLGQFHTLQSILKDIFREDEHGKLKKGEKIKKIKFVWRGLKSPPILSCLNTFHVLIDPIQLKLSQAAVTFFSFHSFSFLKKEITNEQTFYNQKIKAPDLLKTCSFFYKENLLTLLAIIMDNISQKCSSLTFQNFIFAI